MSTANPTGRGGTVYDDPNRESVGLAPAWVEGSGGEGGTAPTPTSVEADDDGGLDAMTKDELLAYAQQIGATPANAGMTKDEIRASIDAVEAG